MVNKSNDQIMIYGKKYNIIETCATSALRKVYKVRDEQNVTYYIKEVKKASSTGSNELENNAAVILDEEAENNSNYFFQTEKLAETDTASYFRIITEAGDPLDRLREKWFKVLSGDAYLSAVVKLMIEVAEALEYMHNEKGLLHIDLKPQNIYAVGKGVDRKIKLLDLGSALPVDRLKGGDDSFAYIETTSEFQSDFLVMLLSCNNSVLLRRLERELSVRDDIFALSCVMAYMLVGEPHAKDIVISRCNRYCLNKLNEILVSAQQGHFFTACGETFECGVYGNVSLIKNDLEILSDALHNKGLSKTIMLKKGREYFDGLLRNRRRRIIPEMIPRLHAENCDSGDINTVDKLCEALKSEKHNISIFCQGGSGKTFLMYDVFRKLSDAVDPSVIPIYLPLGNIGAGEKCVFDAIAEAYTGINKEDLADGMTKSQKLFDFMKTSDLRFAILADSLNETPASDPLLRGYAIENLNQLAQWENISVVMTSRYRELSVSGFEYYTLEPLDEEYLSGCVEGYDSLNKTLRELLRVPFNLCLYLGLDDAPKRKQITNSADLIQANIDEIKSKTNSAVTLNESAFIFDCLFPILAYKMSKSNAMLFTLSDATESALECCWLFDGSTHSTVCDTIKNGTNRFVKRMTSYLRDYEIISFSDCDGTVFEVSHENHRNYFATIGWMLTAERFKVYHNREGEFLNEDTFSIPVVIHSFFRDIVLKKDASIKEACKNVSISNETAQITRQKPLRDNYFDSLFDKTTRGMLHSRSAAGFNNTVLNLMKRAFAYEENGTTMSYFRHDFSELDLSTADFCGSVLDHCDFSGSYMYRRPFGMEHFPERPDLMWNNEDKVTVLYRNGYIRTTFFNNAVIRDREVEPFDACAVDAERIFLLRSSRPRKSIKQHGFITIGEISEYNTDTLKKIRSNELSVPKSAFNALTLRGIFRKNALWEFKIYKAFLYKKEYILFFVSQLMVCFSINEAEFVFYQRDKLFCPSIQSENHFCIPIKQYVFRNSLEVFRTNQDSKYLVLFDKTVSTDDSGTFCDQMNRAIRTDDLKTDYTFTVLLIDVRNSETPVRRYGPFSTDLFAKYGETVDIISDDFGVYAIVIKDSELTVFELCLESGTAKHTDVCFGKKYYSVIKSQRTKIHDREKQKADGKEFISQISIVVGEQRQHQLYEVSYRSGLDDSMLSLNDSAFCLFNDSKLMVGKLDSALQNTGCFIPDLTFPFYSCHTKLLCQDDNRTVAIYSSNSPGYHYNFIEHRFVKKPAEEKTVNPLKSRLTPKYLYRYFSDNGVTVGSKRGMPVYSEDSLHNMPGRFLLCKGSWRVLDDSGFPQGSKRFELREKLKTALKSSHDMLFVYCIELVYQRYLFACAVHKNAMVADYDSDDVCVDTFLILDLETDRLSRIKNPCPFIPSGIFDTEDDFIFADTGFPKRGDCIDYVYLMKQNHVIELCFDLRNDRAVITHDSELLPYVKMFDCNFTDVDIMISSPSVVEESYSSEKIDRIKHDILRTWKENNLKD